MPAPREASSNCLGSVCLQCHERGTGLRRNIPSRGNVQYIVYSSTTVMSTLTTTGNRFLLEEEYSSTLGPQPAAGQLSILMEFQFPKIPVPRRRRGAGEFQPAQVAKYPS